MPTAKPKRVCPNCGRRMKQQFIGLYHCKCGTSKINGGYIERTPDMVFALQRQTAGKTTKQVPVIRYKDSGGNGDNPAPITEVSEKAQTAARFAPISIDAFLKAHQKNNPTGDVKSYRASIEESVQAKKSGAVCAQCGSPIWAIGTATVGWNGCFTCITGESDSSGDYEIDSACF